MNRALGLATVALLVSPALAQGQGIEPLAAIELVVDGGFEAGQAPGPATGFSGTSGSWSWTTSNGGSNPVWTDGPTHSNLPTARTGSWCVNFAPVGNVSNTVSQAVAIPSGSTAILSFWVKIATLETSGLTKYDTLTVRLKSPTGATLSTLATYSNLDATSDFGYVQRSLNVSAWAGQTVRVHFESHNDASRTTTFVLDDVSLTATTGGTDPAGTWVLPSSARVAGTGAFWTTDLILMNQATGTASVHVKFLGHGADGADGPEHTYSIPSLATRTFPDVLFSEFNRQADWGPILIRSDVATLSIQGQTWASSPTGGTYGQSVPALGTADLVGTAAKPIAGVRQDSSFRTNLMLANPKALATTVSVVLLRPDGTTAATRSVTLDPYGFKQLSIATDFGVSSIVNGTFLVSCTTAGGQVAAYASVIDATTADPRTVLAR